MTHSFFETKTVCLLWRNLEMNNLTPKQADYFDKGYQLFTSLTHCEKKVLLLAVKGLSNKQIASSLDKSTKTINQHIDHITKKAYKAYNKHMEFRKDIIPPMYVYYFVSTPELLE